MSCNRGLRTRAQHYDMRFVLVLALALLAIKAHGLEGKNYTFQQQPAAQQQAASLATAQLAAEQNAPSSASAITADAAKTVVLTLTAKPAAAPTPAQPTPAELEALVKAGGQIAALILGVASEAIKASQNVPQETEQNTGATLSIQNKISTLSANNKWTAGTLGGSLRTNRKNDPSVNHDTAAATQRDLHVQQSSAAGANKTSARNSAATHPDGFTLRSRHTNDEPHLPRSNRNEATPARKPDEAQHPAQHQASKQPSTRKPAQTDRTGHRTGRTNRKMQPGSGVAGQVQMRFTSIPPWPAAQPPSRQRNATRPIKPPRAETRPRRDQRTDPQKRAGKDWSTSKGSAQL